MRWSKITRENGRSTYNFEDDSYDPAIFRPNLTFWDKAKLFDESEVFDLDVSEPESALEQIVGFVKFRIRITQREIFKIGELLCKAKKICSKNNKGFQDWIEDNFDFSYPTAKNFMNVHMQCFGQQRIAERIPPSILYKISAPSFPEELREYLFDKGNLEEITNGKLTNIKNKYDKGGLEAVEEDIEEISRASLADHQIRRRMDLVENYLRHLLEIKEKYVGEYPIDRIVGFENQLSYLEPEAVDISKNLLVVIEKAYDMVADAYEEAREKREQFKDKAKERM